MSDHAAGPSFSSIPGSDDEDSPLANSEYLTREEVMKRRARRLRRLAKCYRDHYWVLMEDMRRKHRDFVWKFGSDSFKHGGDGENGGGVVVADTVNTNGDAVSSSGKLGLGFVRCSFPNCRSKAMALTNYCFSHILSDSKQILYTRCQYALKSGDDPILCGKPALKSAVPCMCPHHMKLTEQNIRRALRKGGISTGASNKFAAKFPLVLTEYVRLIQNKRRALVIKRVDDQK